MGVSQARAELPWGLDLYTFSLHPLSPRHWMQAALRKRGVTSGKVGIIIEPVQRAVPKSKLKNEELFINIQPIITVQ